MLQGWWANEFGPNAPDGTYKDKSYWICTETVDEWATQNYPIDLTVYNKSGGFGNGSVPLFIVVGWNNKVYWDGNGSDFRAALRQAIDEMPPTGVYVQNALVDKQYDLGASQEIIDLTNTFTSAEGANPISKVIVTNSNPSVVSASITGNNLIVKASAYNPGTVSITVRGTDQNNAFAEETFNVYVYETTDITVENYNDGNFTAPAFAWTSTNSGSGAKNWIPTTTAPQEGAYCAGTDVALKDDQWCAITTTVNYTGAGIVHFWKKTSTEDGYDFLNFYIDGVLKGQWSGTVAWSQSAFAVASSGNHTFKFEYSKDTSVDGGSDQVWLDNIEVLSSSPVVIPPAPVLATPSNASTTADTTPTFDWNDVAGSTLYDILVDNNSDFSSPEVNTSVPASTYTVATKALANGTYYWKTRVTSASGPYSEPWSLTIGSTIVPGVPANVTTSIVSGNVYINWDDSPNATSYDIYTSTTPYGTYSLLTNVTSSEYTYTPSAEKVFFYIKAKNATK